MFLQMIRKRLLNIPTVSTPNPVLVPLLESHQYRKRLKADAQQARHVVYVVHTLHCVHAYNERLVLLLLTGSTSVPAPGAQC